MLKDFVEETANNPGTGTSVILGGAPAGRRTWRGAGFTNGSQAFYFMSDGSISEWGICTVVLSTTDSIVRDTVLGNSSGTTGRLNFTGTVRVYNALPADRTIYSSATSTQITGDLVISKVGPSVILDKTNTGQTAAVAGRRSGALRWSVELGNTSTEPGDGSGSDFGIARFNDAGVYIDAPFFIQRSTGVVSFTQIPKVGATTVLTTTNFSGSVTSPYIISTLGYTPLNKAGDILTGNLTLNKVEPNLILSKTSSGQSNVVYGSTNSTPRWAIVPGDNAIETGGNAGSNFGINSYNDAGSYVATPLSISRSTGRVTLSTRPQWGGTTPWDNGNFDPNTKADLTGATFTGDIKTYRSGATNTGAIFLNASGSAYLFWNGGSYQLGGAGDIWHTGNFNPGLYAQFTGATFSGTLASTDRIISERASDPIIEVAKPGSIAYGMMITSDNRLTLASTNGIGGFQAARFQTDIFGIAYANSYSTFSDARLKKDIEPIRNSLEKLEQICGYTFAYIDRTEGDKRHLGVVAQEIEGPFPEAINRNDDGTMSVEYSGLIAPIIEAIKELNQRLRAVEARLA